MKANSLQERTTELSRRGQSPTFREAFRFWLKLGFVSFGGPSGQIAMMNAELVEKKKWIGEARFLHALNFCMLLPGPEAQQLAIYIGWLLHKTRGGIIAGTLFVIPSILILWALSYVYVAYGNIPWIAAIFYGLKPAVLAIVAAAVIRIGRRALQTSMMWVIAGAAFIAIYFFRVPFPLIVVSAGVLGFVGGRVWPQYFSVARDDAPSSTPSESDDASEHTRPLLWRALKVCTLSVLLWWLPIALAGILLGTQHTIFREGIFFSKAALVTFGGAYAVLPYVSQQAVENYQWLGPGQMLDGLGLAETTPGPLIMVLQFVGFIGAWNQHGTLTPLTAATLGAAITTWATFLPCFIWIFLGAPHVERMRENTRLAAALSAITAAVVGVILNLAVWFGWHVFHPASGRLDGFAIILALVAFIGLARWKWNV